jgi:hypothetical protein
VDLTETETNASNSSGHPMNQVNHPVAHAFGGASSQGNMTYQLVDSVLNYHGYNG